MSFAETQDLPYESWPWYKGRFSLRTGVVLIAEVGVASFVSVAGLLLVVALRTIKRHARKRAGKALAEDEPIQPVALLFILAMLMELVQAVDNVMSVRWAWNGTTTSGGYCTTQAVLKQLGNTGAALFTMYLGIMTLIPTIWPSALIGNRGRKVVYWMIASVVVFWLFLITIPATVIHSYYGPTGPWCWIPTKNPDGSTSTRQEAMGILTEYGWMWIASLTCFVCYGYIVYRWYSDAKLDARINGEAMDPEMARQAFVMAWYPIAYFVEIFPQSVVRILAMHNAIKGTKLPPPGVTVLTSILFASSGWVNVLLWVITGRQYGFTAASVKVQDSESDLVEAKPIGRSEYMGGMYGVEQNARGASLERELIPADSLAPLQPYNPAFPSPSSSNPHRVSSYGGSATASATSPHSPHAYLPEQPYIPQPYGAGGFDATHTAGGGYPMNDHDAFAAYQPAVYQPPGTAEGESEVGGYNAGPYGR